MSGGQSSLKMYSNIGRIFHETAPLMPVLCLSGCIALHFFPGQFCEFNSELCCAAKGKISSNPLKKMYCKENIGAQDHIKGRWHEI